MSKLFHDIITEEPVDGEYYYLFTKFGALIGEGEWEADNQDFYNNQDDITFLPENIDYFMSAPSKEQLKSL